MKHTIYRLDKYTLEMGDLVGFYKTLRECQWALSGDFCKTPLNQQPPGPEYAQVTKTKVPVNELSLQAWMKGEIVKTVYFKRRIK
jgi:hypothetical protein